jgi:hypothetical protein
MIPRRWVIGARLPRQHGRFIFKGRMVILSLHFLGVAGFECDCFLMGAILGAIPVFGLALDRS